VGGVVLDGQFGFGGFREIVRRYECCFWMHMGGRARVFDIHIDTKSETRRDRVTIR
jgi:hypothetical protein